MPLPVDMACPPTTPRAEVRVEVVNTGWVQADWARVSTDGREGEVQLPLLVGMIHHPRGLVLVDSGLGLATREGRYPGFPLSLLGGHEIPAGMPLAERLTEVPLLVLMTHLHYDHVGGLLDIRPREVWTTEADLLRYHGAGLGLNRALRREVPWAPKDLRAGAATQRLGRPALDVLGDGSVWYLSLPGHTPGAAAVLVQADDGPWLFIGDTAWVDAHLEDARRPFLTRLLIDAEPRAALDSLLWARMLKERCPSLRIIPGHEPRLADGLSSHPLEPSP